MAKLLFLTSRFPYPLEKGDKLRAFNPHSPAFATRALIPARL